MIRCLERNDDGTDACTKEAIAVAWGCLYTKQQVGPKCAEHLDKHHPALGALIPGPFAGPHAITWLEKVNG